MNDEGRSPASAGRATTRSGMRRPPRSLAVWAVVLAAAAAGAIVLLRSGPGGPARERPRLVLLYAPCTVNRSFLSPYDPSVPYTPALQRFAERAKVFTRHNTESGKSGVAYASLLTGTQVMDHGVFSHPARLPDSLQTIGEAFAEAGYETFYWNRHAMAAPALNYAQGIPHDHVFPGKLDGNDPPFRRLLHALESGEIERAFVVATFSITHAPYWGGWRERFCKRYPHECAGLEERHFERYGPLVSDLEELLDFIYDFDNACRRHGFSAEEVKELGAVVRVLYASNVNRLDTMFGTVLAQLQAHGLMDDSVIAFTADHGEVLQRENATYKWTHGLALAPEVIQVPFLLSGPGIEPGRYEGVTRSIDVFPTLAGLAGIDLRGSTATGVDLSRAVLGLEEPPRLHAFVHTALPAEYTLAMGYPSVLSRFPRRDAALMWVGVRDLDLVYKLTGDGGTARGEVYDWAADPTERENLYDPGDAHQAEMFGELTDYRERLVEAQVAWRARKTPQALSESQKEILRSLGYMRPK